MARPASHTRTFQRKESNSRELTHERIADDLQAFLDGGGRIEVLGVTRSLTKVGVDAPVVEAAANATPGRRRK